jgi:hypothetical protein
MDIKELLAPGWFKALKGVMNGETELINHVMAVYKWETTGQGTPTPRCVDWCSYHDFAMDLIKEIDDTIEKGTLLAVHSNTEQDDPSDHECDGDESIHLYISDLSENEEEGGVPYDDTSVEEHDDTSVEELEEEEPEVWQPNIVEEETINTDTIVE